MPLTASRAGRRRRRRGRSAASSALVVSHATAALVGFLLARPAARAPPPPCGGASRARRAPYTGAPWQQAERDAPRARSIVETPFARAELHTVRGEDGSVIRDWLWFDERDHVNVLARRARPRAGTSSSSASASTRWRPTLAPVGGFIEHGRERGRRGLAREARGARPRGGDAHAARRVPHGREPRRRRAPRLLRRRLLRARREPPAARRPRGAGARRAAARRAAERAPRGRVPGGQVERDDRARDPALDAAGAGAGAVAARRPAARARSRPPAGSARAWQIADSKRQWRRARRRWKRAWARRAACACALSGRVGDARRDRRHVGALPKGFVVGRCGSASLCPRQHATAQSAASATSPRAAGRTPLASTQFLSVPMVLSP